MRCLAALKRAVGGQGEVVVPDATTVNEVLQSLHHRYGEEFKGRVFDGAGKVRRYIAIQVNGKDIRHLAGLETKVNDTDEITLLPMVAGG